MQHRDWYSRKCSETINKLFSIKKEKQYMMFLDILSELNFLLECNVERKKEIINSNNYLEYFYNIHFINLTFKNY